MPLSKSTSQIQKKLGRYVRDGEKPDLPGITQGRLGTYRRLVYNVVDDSLRTAYPLTEKMLTKEDWDLLVDTFFQEHDCQESQVMRMPRELASWNGKPQPLLAKYPGLEDLLWFEWVEVELYIMEDLPTPEFRLKGDWWVDRWVLNPESQILQLDFPVHKTPPGEIREEMKGQYFCLAFRSPDTFAVEFVDLSALWVELLRLVGEGTHPAKAVEWLSDAVGMDPPKIQSAALPLLNDLKTRGFIRGFA